MAKTKKVSKKAKKSAAKNAPFVFDKYALYKKAVQSPENDVVFLKNAYKELKKKDAKIFREDFCGTFALSTEWIKLSPKHQTVSIDLDTEPMDYGKLHYQSLLSAEQQNRMTLINGNVLDPKLPKADIIAAMNFSYFCFKNRETMKNYFLNAYKTLNKDGIFLVDIFGGSQCYAPIEDEIKHEGFTYFWDQTDFDPVTNEALFHIHFKVGGKKVEQVFSYDWRMWSIPELKDILREAGFKKIHVYWEGTNKDGSGDGNFNRVSKGEACESWIAYIVSEK